MLNKTPLRYPGGKSIMTPLFVDLIKINDMKHVTYAEPYAGGAGAAVNLLLSDSVDRIMINDANIAIYSFWKSIIEESGKFCDAISKVSVDLDTWKKMRAIIDKSHDYSFELGFATFFLSRTNRSGIINAGPIGGGTMESQAKATYKIDCRFNRENLIKRVQAISERKKQIIVTNKDAIKFLKDLRNNKYFVYLDPPYYKNGKTLYMNFYQPKDHLELARYLSSCKKISWVLSYDDVPEIRAMYSSFQLYNFSLKYTAQTKKTGQELLCLSKDLTMPKAFVLRQGKKSNTTIKETTK